MLCKFQCGLCNGSYYGECVRHLTVRSGELIGISPSLNKRVQSRKDSPAFEDFSVLCQENKKYFLELKESLLKLRDKPSMN